MPWITRQAVVDAASPYVGTRIDRLVQELAGGTRSHVAGLFDHDCVTFNGQTMHETGWRLAADDRVEVRFEAGRRYSPLPKARPHRGFVVVYEDRDLIVVDKAPELLTVPTQRGERYTLAERVSEYVRRSGGGRGAFPYTGWTAASRACWSWASRRIWKSSYGINSPRGSRSGSMWQSSPDI